MLAHQDRADPVLWRFERLIANIAVAEAVPFSVDGTPIEDVAVICDAEGYLPALLYAGSQTLKIARGVVEPFAVVEDPGALTGYAATGLGGSRLSEMALAILDVFKRSTVDNRIDLGAVVRAWHDADKSPHVALAPKAA